jgi:hypothetical protein
MESFGVTGIKSSVPGTAALADDVMCILRFERLRNYKF